MFQVPEEVSNMTENSEEKEVKAPDKQGVHINKKHVVSFIALLLIAGALLSLVGGKKEAKKPQETRYEEKMTVSDVSDLPSSYADMAPEKESNYYEYKGNSNQEQVVYYQDTSRVDQEREQLLQKLNQEADLAKRSGIGFATNNKNYGQNSSSTTGSGSNPPQDYDLNRQGSKKDFLMNAESNPNYLGNSEEYPISPYEVKAGTIIPGVMITGINSDLPGNIVGQVRERVFDTVTGNHLLIPQGTKIFGVYDSNVTWGQERALIVWQRLIFPNGKSVNLSNMPGVDLTGQAGFKDKVNNHFGTLLKGVVLSSVAGAGAAIVTDDNDDDDTDYASEAGKAAGIAVINIGNKFADKALDRQPTIEIRPGYRFNIMVHRDMILTPYE
jgi:type IV secretion system protein VirB10